MRRTEVHPAHLENAQTPWHEANAQRRHLNPTIRALVPFGALALVVVDQGLNAHMCWNQLYVNYPQETHDTYVSAVDAQMKGARRARCARFLSRDKTYNRTGAAFNEGISHGFNQLSTYSSASNPKAVAFLNALGYSSEGEFSSVYAASNLVMDSLLGVCYMGSWTQPVASNATGIAGSTIVSPVYVDPYALSLGLPCDSDRIASRLPEGTTPLSVKMTCLHKSRHRRAADTNLYRRQHQRRDATQITWNVELPANTIGDVYVQTGVESNWSKKRQPPH